MGLFRKRKGLGGKPHTIGKLTGFFFRKGWQPLSNPVWKASRVQSRVRVNPKLALAIAARGWSEGRKERLVQDIRRGHPETPVRKMKGPQRPILSLFLEEQLPLAPRSISARKELAKELEGLVDARKPSARARAQRKLSEIMDSAAQVRAINTALRELPGGRTIYTHLHRRFSALGFYSQRADELVAGCVNALGARGAFEGMEGQLFEVEETLHRGRKSYRVTVEVFFEDGEYKSNIRVYSSMKRD